mmetsp:Transcript_826/g.1240  ORF Transcript_826/g.1240 Transcript_826/m.1240 type:complete len:245 (-) Transcript_826:72-806(-)
MARAVDEVGQVALSRAAFKHQRHRHCLYAHAAGLLVHTSVSKFQLLLWVLRLGPQVMCLLHQHIHDCGLAMMHMAHHCHVAHKLRVGHKSGHKLICEAGPHRLLLQGLKFFLSDGRNDRHLKWLSVLLLHQCLYTSSINLLRSGVVFLVLMQHDCILHGPCLLTLICIHGHCSLILGHVASLHPRISSRFCFFIIKVGFFLFLLAGQVWPDVVAKLIIQVAVSHDECSNHSLSDSPARSSTSVS